MADQEPLFKSDPANYRAMSVPFDSAEEAGEALRGFQKDVEDARRKHRMRDVLVVVAVPAKDSDGHEGLAHTHFSFGDVMATVTLAAYAFGETQAFIKDHIARLAAGSKPRR